MARRNHRPERYGLRGLVSGGQGRRTGGGRTWPPGDHDSCCWGRTDAVRRTRGERCTARSAPAQVWDARVGPALCRGPERSPRMTYALERAQMGVWWPQALHARRPTRRDVLAQLERHPARRRDLSLAEVSEREACTRRRKEVA